MIAVDHMPLSITEKKGFKFFKKKSVPLYKPPSKNTIIKLLDEKYEILGERLKQIYITLTTDIWADTLNIRSYLFITLQFIIVKIGN
jgi:hypothetical protein